jgi:hypothetical protein
LDHHNVSIVLITDDAENRRLAQEQSGLTTFTIKDYVEGMTECSMMADKLSKKGDSKLELNKKFLFPEHLAPAEINARIKSGKLVQGVFYLSRTNFQEGSVNSEALDEPILIQGTICI